MAKYNAIKAAVNAYIKENGRKEITGKILNAVLNATIESLGRFFQFAGVAFPTDDPGTPDQNVCYLAVTEGEYSHFGGKVLAAGEIAVIKFDGNWVKQTICTIPAKVSDLVNDTGFITDNVSDLLHYYDKDEVDSIVASLTRNEFVVSWDGTTTPVVADIPSGVQVIYNGVTYTGTLAPSKSTSGKIYLVNNGASYDMYVTIEDSVYSWISLGSMTLDLTGYATTADLYALEERLYGSETSVSPVGLSTGRVLKTNGDLASVGSSSSVVRKFDVVAGEKYKVSGRVGSTNNTCLYCFFDTDGVRLSYGNVSTSSATPYLNVEVIAPEGAVAIRVAGSTQYDYDASLTHLVDGSIDELDARIGVLEDRVDAITQTPTRTIVPKLSIAAITLDTGRLTTDYYGRKFWSSVRYIKVVGDSTLSVKCSASLYLQASWYDGNYSYLSKDMVSVSSTAVSVQVPSSARFVRMRLSNGATSGESTEIPCPVVEVTGKFDENWSTGCPRPATGYESLTIPVRLYDPDATDDQTDSVQDSRAIYADYGVLALPDQYSVGGTPTRLIIYCHGAGANYSSGEADFSSANLNPDYWLSEGYAVMDMEGNPFNNADDHFCIPQAYQCYKAAYDWVVENYNIRKDGIFLGGRSMGGLMTLDILTQERDIPVIAACPNVPCVVPTWYWNYMNGTRRGFCANHMGFVGDAPAWSDTSPMPSSQWQYLQDNFEKMAMSSPFWRLINNLPDKADLFNGTNVSKTSTNASAENAVYANCRLRLKAPMKVFMVKDDASVIYQRNGAILVKVAQQSGQICVARYFQSGGHQYEYTNPDLQVTITNTYGVRITTSVVYIEMLAWWKEWELCN